MSGLRRFLLRLVALFRKTRMETELDEEIRFHLDMETAENRRRGMEPGEAYRTARLRFGGVESVKAAYRDAGRLPWIEIFFSDAGYALRRMARSPGFTVVVVVTLALGIGATSALWSVVDAVLLKALPYPEPERLVSVILERADGNYSINTQNTFEYVRDNASSFEHAAGSSIGSGINLAAGDEAEYVDSLRVSAGWFEVLGIAPQRGRGFELAEEAQGGPAVAVISHALWQRRFGGALDVVGSSVHLGGEPHSIVGVLPEGFRSMPPSDVFRPLRRDFEGQGTNLRVIARLDDGVSLAQARAELEALSRWPERPQIISEELVLSPVPYREILTRGTRAPILVLLGAVGMVLLIACANVACLLLVRASARRREIALRTAVGGGRRRLLHQLLTESLMIAVIGGALGVAVAHFGVRALLALGPGSLGVWQIGVDLRVLVATLLVSLMTGLVFGLAPAFVATRVELRDALSEGGGQLSGGRRSGWLRRALVVAEVALSVVLLIGAGLLIRTFYNLRHVELGFDPERVLTAQMAFQGSGYSERDWFVSLYDRSLERIRRLPGVERAAVGSALPVERGLNLQVRVPASPTTPDPTTVFVYYVSADYFSVLGIPLVAGRAFDERDSSTSGPVAMVNSAFARRFFEGGNALGHDVEIAFGEAVPPYRVVGQVGEVKDWGLTSEARPVLYLPVHQVSSSLFTITHRWFDANWLVKLREDHAGASPVAGMREVVRSIDPRLPFSGFRMMDDVVAGAADFERFLAVLLGVFAALALAMAVAGIYGLLAYNVVQRTREIGVRMALGATGGDTLRLILREGVVLAAIGIVAGCAGALGLVRLIESFVFGVSTSDPATYAGIVAGFLAVALVASLVPGLKAVRLDPVSTLREE